MDTSTETFAYDKLSRLIRNGTALGTFDLCYLGETGQITSQQISTGTVGTAWQYEPNVNDRRLKAIINGGAARGFHFTTTPENLITQIRESAPWGSAWTPGFWEYKYDNAYRLTQGASSASTYAYGLDPADNITSYQLPSGNTSASYNNLNQIVDFGSQAYSYDKNGNLLNDGTRTYTWDAENRLFSITHNAQPALATTFKYDGLGRRTAVDTSNGARTTAIRYLWCGEQLCQARTSANVVERRYYSEGEYLPLGGTSLYYSRDQLGSVRDVFATQSGSRVAAFDYDPYGNPSQSNGRVSTDFRYGGLFYDQQNGLYLSRHRAYSPMTGKWLSRDLIDRLSGNNLYGYVAANPIIGIDPLGLWTLQITFWIGFEDQFTIAINGGKLSIGNAVGIGQGYSFRFNPKDTGCHKSGTEFNAYESFEAKWGTTGVDVGLEASWNGGGNVSGTFFIPPWDYAGGQLTYQGGLPPTFTFGPNNTIGYGESTFIGVGPVVTF